jgi:hypothetical protein
MKRIITLTCGLLAILAMPAIAAAQPAHAANSPKADFRVMEPLIVGDTTLAPGEYKFQCKRIGDKEFLVVTSADEGNEVARVPCRPEDLQTKIDVSDFRSTLRPDGTHVLTAVRIKGEMVAHRLVLD